jgi:cytosine permease
VGKAGLLIPVGISRTTDLRGAARATASDRVPEPDPV